MNRLLFASALYALQLFQPAHANVPQRLLLPACASPIADHYSVPRDLLQAIRIQEGGARGKFGPPNRNGTRDIGPMQINNGWIQGRFRIDIRQYGITEAELLNNECTNIAVAAWILRSNYDTLQAWPEAVAAYNAGVANRRAGYRYARSVYAHLARLRQNIPAPPSKAPRLATTVQAQQVHERPAAPGRPRPSTRIMSPTLIAGK